MFVHARIMVKQWCHFKVGAGEDPFQVCNILCRCETERCPVKENYSRNELNTIIVKRAAK